MAILGGLEVDRLREVQLLDDDTGTHVEVLANDFDQLVGAFVGGTIRLDKEREWLGDTDGVGQLDQSAASQLGVDERLRNPASEVRSRAIDLAVVLARESTTTVSTPAAVRVDDDLAASEAGVTLWSTNDEEARWLDLWYVSEHSPFDHCMIDSRGRWSCHPGTSPEWSS